MNTLISNTPQWIKKTIRKLRTFSFRSFLLKRRLHKSGSCLKINWKGVEIKNPRYISIGDHVYINKHVELLAAPNMDKQPELIIGSNVHFGKYNCIGCSNKIVIGDHVLFAPYVHITDRNHAFEDIHTPIWLQPTTSSGPVIIGGGTWLGFGAQVMPGVSIGRHCVIAAGSVVTHDIPDYSVAAGVPAKVIKTYDSASKQWKKTTLK